MGVIGNERAYYLAKLISRSSSWTTDNKLFVSIGPHFFSKLLRMSGVSDGHRWPNNWNQFVPIFFYVYGSSRSFVLLSLFTSGLIIIVCQHAFNRYLNSFFSVSVMIRHSRFPNVFGFNDFLSALVSDDIPRYDCAIRVPVIMYWKQTIYTLRKCSVERWLSISKIVYV